MSIALLELPEIRQHVSPLLVEDYHRMGEYDANGRRTELIRGIIIEKMSKTPLHSSLIWWLIKHLETLLPPDGVIIRNQEPITLRDSEPEPDVAVVLGFPRDFRTAHPTTAELVIEIAISTLALDREKVAIYAEADIPEYWLIIPGAGIVEVFRRPENGRYQERSVLSDDEIVACAALPSLRLRVADIFTMA